MVSVPTLPAPEAAPEAPVVEKVKPAPKKAAAKKAPAKKAPAKKATAKKAEKKEKAPRADKLSGSQVKILNVLNRNSNGLTRSEVSAKLENMFIGNSSLGHVDSPAESAEKSLLGRKFISVHTGEPKKLSDGSVSESEGPKVLKITAAGKKALEAAKA